MPLKLLKRETGSEFIIEKILYAKRFSLTLDKARCVGCGICMDICPKEAIEFKKVSRGKGKKANPPIVIINEQKCHYCGICTSLCPFRALEMMINGEETIPVIEKGSFPELIRDITIEADKCEESCVDCEKYCPLNLIKIRFKNRNVDLNIDKDHCVCCRICELKCPHDAIRIQKMFFGKITVNQEKCFKGCHDCIDVCPITGTLYLAEDGKVHVNELTCIYCGVCKIVCPENLALELQRTYIRHTPVHSGAWNKALEKLTSAESMSKELSIKSSAKSWETVKKLIQRRQEA
ncbi:MAG: 4Fe-4S dicluster domain-containing protein [Candidatus Bathyarchaeota archaeon]